MVLLNRLNPESAEDTLQLAGGLSLIKNRTLSAPDVTGCCGPSGDNPAGRLPLVADGLGSQAMGQESARGTAAADPRNGS